MNTGLAIIKTLAYHDIFSYPLKVGEIENFLGEKSNRQKLEESLKRLAKEKKIGEYQGYYFLKKKEGHSRFTSKTL